MIDIFLINLQHRTDRLQECKDNFLNYGLDFSKINIINGVYEESYGSLGCAKSHILTLSNYLTHHSGQYAIVLEDDFDFKRSFYDVIQEINSLLESKVPFDLVLLGATHPVTYSESISGFNRVVEAKSTCAYFVKTEYVAKLNYCFSQAAYLLEKYRNAKEIMIPKFAIDIFWNRLQVIDKWYLLANTAGFQRKSYSDIEKKIVDYNKMSA